MGAKENFERVCHYVGFGDPDGGLWFMGIEESKAWKSTDEINEFFGPRPGLSWRGAAACVCEKPAESRSERIAEWEAKIAAPLSTSRKDLETFKNEVLWSRDSKVFHANVYPLCKPGTDPEKWPDSYRELFGFSRDDRARYESAVRDVRFPILKELRAEAKPQAIVCLGQEYWPVFRDLLGLSESDEGPHDPKLEVFSRDRVILAPHYSYGHLSSVAEEITQVLASWGVAIP